MSELLAIVVFRFENFSPVVLSLLIGLAVFAALVALGFLYLSRKPSSGTNSSSHRKPRRTPGRRLRASSEAPPEREAFLRTLDSIQRYVGHLYIFLLYVAMAAATAMMALLYFKYPEDGHRQFMLLYGGVIYFIGMLGLTTGASKMRARLSPRADDGLTPQFLSNINVSVESSPHVQFIDYAKLDLAQHHLDAGASLDDACAIMDARYRNMKGVMQIAFRNAMEAALEERRKSLR